ncbi:hypothetical protein PoB_002181400 [Plakobranchus ocellatus]|uniref:Uncharacterized protein n=1 Tax=Plakobranchus ocellatus TaxID=259542 RepID=A0AAV3ZJ12_9GAST|nr:hypothetical protein PoB_002181400 [Plakobranchus ocellatus]
MPIDHGFDSQCAPKRSFTPTVSTQNQYVGKSTVSTQNQYGWQLQCLHSEPIWLATSASPLRTNMIGNFIVSTQNQYGWQPQCLHSEAIWLGWLGLQLRNSICLEKQWQTFFHCCERRNDACKN